MRCLVLAVLFAGGGAAASSQQTPGAGQPEPVLVDAVIATVNDSPIMLSTVRTAESGVVRAETARLGTLPQPYLEQIRRKFLDDEILRHRMAQSAKTFGPLTPAQVEQYLEETLERERNELVRDLGSTNEYTRQLQRTGRNWPMLMRDQRVEKLSEVAVQMTVHRRLSRQTNLFVTPRMLRETYTKNREWFVHDAEAQIVQLRFTGPDAKANADAAAAAWRAEPTLDARQLAARLQVPGVQVVGAVNAASLAESYAELRTFAFAGPEGAVSPAITIGTGGDVAYHVARIDQFRAASDGRFEDPDVQERLRDFCASEVVREFREQAYERASERTEVRRY